MINCIAIDDEPRALEVIERYCQKSGSVNLKGSFREPVKAIEFLNREPADLIFLDINMPDVNGIQLISTLAIKPMVIFTTAYSEHAVESYKLNAVDYLLKPITFERFLAATNKALGLHALKDKALQKQTTGGQVFIKSGAQTYQLKLDDILYLQKDGNYITLVLKDKNILIRENMGDIFDVIPSANFVRVHKSFIVAIKHITMIEVHQVTINGAKIPVGSTYREDLRARLGLD
ncbi:LytTR family DNA-binding domain-containing protein [soil metagenome]|jgi:two-component system LytT family response regulator